MLKKWKILSSKIVFKTPWFEIYKDSCKTAENHFVPTYYTWKKRDCVIIFPVTKYHEVILIKQYRHGLKKVCIDYPGGTIDRGYSIFEAAKHELREETGYETDKFELIGNYAMDSSYSNQMTHFVFAKECEQRSKPSNPREVTEIIKIPKETLADFVEKNVECILCSLITYKGISYFNKLISSQKTK